MKTLLLFFVFVFVWWWWGCFGGGAVDFGCWLVSRGFTTVGQRVGYFGSAVYMGVWAVCSGHGELDFGVRLSRWLLVFWR